MALEVHMDTGSGPELLTRVALEVDTGSGPEMLTSPNFFENDL